jgi:peptidyl-prolyl cis-trans isomerase SurA
MKSRAGILSAFAAGCLAAGSLPAQGVAPAAPLRGIEVDKIVAVVGTQAILFSEVLEAINYARAQGLTLPPDSAGQVEVARRMLNDMVDVEVLLAVAKDFKIEVSEVEVSPDVDKNIERIRGQFETEQQFRTALQREGYGTPEEYRRKSIERAKRERMQRVALDSLKAQGRLAPANVTEREVAEAFEKAREQLQPRPATVAFRQIIVKPVASAAAIAAARAKLDSIRLAIDSGQITFEDAAKQFSVDGSAAEGGDLNWARRGQMVAEFERVMFGMPPGRVSPVFESQYGFHILRVDRVRAAEVRSRHILIKPAVDSADVETARLRADSVAALWRSGTPFDTLVAKFHDKAEEKVIPEGYPRDSLPAEYRVALRDVPVNGFTPVFALPDAATGFNKWGVIQVTTVREAGTFTLEEYQERVRNQLREEKATRRTLDNLRREMYVSLRL